MRKTLLLSIFFTVASVSFAQQDKQLTHYMFDRMSFNPAATGFKGWCGTLIYRNQWDRVQDAPNTTLLNVQMNFPGSNMGAGLSFTNDAIGFQRNNTLTANWAYHMNVGPGVLSTGIGIGMVNVAFSPTWIPPQGDWQNDPLLTGALAGTGLDLNVGLFWHGTKHPYYVGISSTHIAPPTLKALNFNVARHYYVIAGYDFRMDVGRPITLKPSVLVKADGAGAVFDLNCMAEVWMSDESFLWGGVTYRMSDAVAIQAGWANQIGKNMIKFGYSFDIMTNPLRQYGKGTHELMINFCMPSPPRLFGRHGNPFILE